MIKGSIYQENITILNIYATNTRTLTYTKYSKQILTDPKVEIDNTIIVGAFSIPLPTMDRLSIQKINKETLNFNCTSDQINLTGIYRIFHPAAAEYTFVSSTQGLFSRIDHMLGDKTNLSKFKKIETILSIFSDYSVMKLEINNRKKTVKILKYVEIKQ